MPGQGPGEASEQQAASLIACCSGLRSSGSRLCDAPGCIRSSATDTTLSLCPCCNRVALCSDCVTSVYTPYPFLLDAIKERGQSALAPLCPACVAAAYRGESWFVETVAAQADAAVAAVQPCLLERQDALLAAAVAASALPPIPTTPLRYPTCSTILSSPAPW